MDPYKIRKDFPMYRNNTQMQGKPLVWLDNASTTFKPDCVIQAVTDYYSKETANSHRGDYDLCYNADRRIESARHTVAEFLGAEDKEIVFTAGTTESINLVAYGYGLKSLKPGDEILLSGHQAKIEDWLYEQSLAHTMERRPDLLDEQ